MYNNRNPVVNFSRLKMTNEATQIQKAKYSEKLDNNTVQCLLCSNECILKENILSRCLSRKNINGEMILCNYAITSCMAVDPIEKKPLYHFYPGTKVFSMGGWGCNFTCIHCQNDGISQPKLNAERKSYFVPPQEAIRLTIEHNCQGISWTYNEPAIWFEYTLDSARLAKEKGLYTAYVTNGFIQEKPLREIAPYLDAYRVDFKAFDDKFYSEVCGVKNWMNVYKNAVLAKELGMHVEAITNIIPGYNDSDKTLSDIAKFIYENLGPDTPWQATRFHPNNKLLHLNATPQETIEKAYQIGINSGLKFVYIGNLGFRTDTVCPECKTVAIKRSIPVEVSLGPNGTCVRCGNNLNIVN